MPDFEYVVVAAFGDYQRGHVFASAEDLEKHEDRLHTHVIRRAVVKPAEQTAQAA